MLGIAAIFSYLCNVIKTRGKRAHERYGKSLSR